MITTPIIYIVHDNVYLCLENFSISAVLQILVERYITAVRRLVPKVEQLEVDVNDIRDNMNQLTNKVPIIAVFDEHNVNYFLNTAGGVFYKMITSYQTDIRCCMSEKDKP